MGIHFRIEGLACKGRNFEIGTGRKTHEGIERYLYIFLGFEFCSEANKLKLGSYHWLGFRAT